MSFQNKNIIIVNEWHFIRNMHLNISDVFVDECDTKLLRRIGISRDVILMLSKQESFAEDI